MTTEKTTASTPDPRDDPANWIAQDSLLTTAEAEWYAKHWRERHARIEYRDPGESDSGVTRVTPVPSAN